MILFYIFTMDDLTKGVRLNICDVNGGVQHVFSFTQVCRYEIFSENIVILIRFK